MTASLFDDGKGGPVEFHQNDAMPPPCRHRMDPLPFMSGTRVYASSHHATRDDDELRPDFGLYLDQVWHPDCIAFYCYWPDFDIPDLELEKFIELLQIVHAYAEKWAVEVGCIGGHGRTGTALACMALVDDLAETPHTAIDRVRTIYCQKAVETERQYWLVEAVYASLHGLEVPEKPAKPAWKSTTTSKSWDQGNCEKGEYKGKKAKVSEDAAGTKYCAECLADLKTPDDKECNWCGATFKGVLA